VWIARVILLAVMQRKMKCSRKMKIKMKEGRCKRADNQVH